MVKKEGLFTLLVHVLGRLGEKNQFKKYPYFADSISFHQGHQIMYKLKESFIKTVIVNIRR